MKKYYPFLLVLAIPVILILQANSSGSPGGKTGSIGDNGTTCTQCHNGSATTVANWITTNIPFQGYTAGQTYTITATGTHAGVVKFGFELTVEDSQGNKVGTLMLTEPARTKFTNSSQAVTHTAAGNVPIGNSNTWTMNWVAPSGVDGSIGIYAAFNAANGTGNTSGDVIYKSSRFIAEYIPTPLLISIDPGEAAQGDSFTATITGTNTNFNAFSTVSLSFSENPFEIINSSNVNVISSTVLEAQFALQSTSSAGLWDVHVDDLLLENAFTVLLVSGIAGNNIDVVKVYPNPASQRFYLENADGSEVSVFNSKGEMLVMQKINSEKQEINISQFTSGMYLVRIRANETTRVEKLLVN